MCDLWNIPKRKIIVTKWNSFILIMIFKPLIWPVKNCHKWWNFFLQGILFDIVSICVLHIRNIKCILHCHQLNPMSNFLSPMHLCISRMEWLSIDLKCSAFFVSLVFVFVIQFSHFWIENDIYFRKWVKFSS